MPLRWYMECGPSQQRGGLGYLKRAQRKCSDGKGGGGGGVKEHFLDIG